MIIISMSILGMMFKLEFELGLGLGLGLVRVYEYIRDDV
jgi:hypothetical protein